ncbi:LysM peptidoglycan-binding domain-containing protein [Polaribacter sp. KT25b]|uniref:LysM peptidoglycan-binding domain-containing protein n=1 Tax=Polaribacter sp. KT25b TaxID=1855336 RepID=UPI001E426530|nr:LysM peptidoglycan-binding domain-containing protein [Polaribacter sp. KT25b]
MKHLKFFIFLCILTFTVSCGQQNRYIQYKVKKGETIYTIAKNLNMKEKDLIRLNPDVNGGLRADSFIVVPEKSLNYYNSKKLNEDTDIVDAESISVEEEIIDEKTKLINELKERFVIHEIQKGETFYSLSKAFNVSRGELLLLNPELVEGLKVGQILKIREIPVSAITDVTFYEDYIQPNTSLKVALLLPFKADQYNIDTLAPKEIFSKNATLVNIATDFYLGAEIAVDSLRNRGVAIELNVFDTGDRNTTEIRSILANRDFNNNDVVIGPLYSEEVQMVANNVNIPVVFPVYSNKQSEFSSSNIVKTSPDKSIFRLELERYIKENFDHGNIIIVSDDKAASLETSRILKSSLQTKIDASSIHLLTPDKGYIAKSRFSQILKPNAKNWVILASDSNLIIADVINSLISLPEETTAKVFTFDKSSVYENVDNRKLAKIGFTYVSDEFVDENSMETSAFNTQYYKKNNTLPSFYATKGFDITYDILVRLASGNDLKSTFKEGATSRIETRFDYRNNNTENQGLFIVQYNKDLTLTKLK